MAPAIKPSSRASSGWANAASNSNTRTEVQHVPFQESHQVKCTHSDCKKLFETDKEMRRHKRDNPQHFYCYKCDVDCEDWEDLTRHKVDMMAPFLERRVIATDDNKPKHIVCEFCGEDFKSFGGRKLHRQQAHPADQDIECPGCKSHFVRAANMIVHIEDNGCSEIRPHELFRAICHKFVVKQVLRAPDNFRVNQGPAGPTPPAGPAVTDGTETHDQDDGGVSLLDQEDEAQLAGYKPLSSASDYTSTASPTPSRASMNVRPAPPSQASLTQSMRSMSITTATPRSVSGTSAGSYNHSYPYLTPDTSAVVQAMAPNSGKPSAWGTSSNASKKLFPKAQPTPLQAGDWNAVLAQREDEALADDGNNLMKARWWDPSSPDYNPNIFKDESTGVYTCRFPDCISDGIAFHALVDLQDHITMSHLPERFQCPSCFKRFKKASALVGHAENTRKCNVRASGGFKSLIAEITGGLLDAKSVSVPKIYRPDTALVKFGKEPTHGIMDTKFTAKPFDT